MTKKERIRATTPNDLKKYIIKWKNILEESVVFYREMHQFCLKNGIFVKNKGRIKQFDRYLKGIEQTESKIVELEKLIEDIYKDMERHTDRIWDVSENTDIQEAIDEHDKKIEQGKIKPYFCK